MKVDNEKVLRKQREKNKTITLAGRRRKKEMERRMEAHIYDERETAGQQCKYR